MSYKIEKTPLQLDRRDFREFVLALKALEVGESFIYPGTNLSNRRQAISIVQMLFGVTFTTRTEKHGLRIVRIA